MSGKGSAPRKQRNDKAYAENWDKIFGKKEPDAIPEWMDKQIKDTASLSAEMDAVRASMEGKPYGVLYINGVGPKTCGNCKHRIDGCCESREVREMFDLNYGGFNGFLPPADFSCSKWEAK